MKKEIAAEFGGLAEWLEKEGPEVVPERKKRELSKAEKRRRRRRRKEARRTDLNDPAVRMGMTIFGEQALGLEASVLSSGDVGEAMGILASNRDSLSELMDAGLYGPLVFQADFVKQLTGEQAEKMERILLKGGDKRAIEAWMARKRAMAMAMRSGGEKKEMRKGSKASERMKEFDLRMARARNCAEYLEALEEEWVGKKELTKSAWTERIYQKDIFEGASEALKGRMAKWLGAVWRPVQLRFRVQMAESEGLDRKWAKALFDPETVRKMADGRVPTDVTEKLTDMILRCEKVRHFCRESEWVRELAGSEDGVEGNYLRYAFSGWTKVAKGHFISRQGAHTEQVTKAIEGDNVAGFEMARDLYGLSFTKGNLRYIVKCGARAIMRHQIEEKWERLEKIMGARELAFYLCANAWGDYGFAEEMVKALDGRFPGLFRGLKDCNGESPLDYVRYSEDREWEKERRLRLLNEEWWKWTKEEKERRENKKREARESLERTLIGLGCDPDNAPKGGLSHNERVHGVRCAGGKVSRD